MKIKIFSFLVCFAAFAFLDIAFWQEQSGSVPELLGQAITAFIVTSTFFLVAHFSNKNKNNSNDL